MNSANPWTWIIVVALGFVAGCWLIASVRARRARRRRLLNLES